MFMGSSKFTNQEIYMQYSVNVDRNSMAMQVSRSGCEGFYEVLYSHCSGED